MASVFTRILNKEIPGYFIAEDDHFFAILDINPLAKGHVLAIPKIEIDYIFDLDKNVLSNYLVFTKRVAKAIESVIPCERIGVSVIGLEVPHAHVHLVPINSISDLDFSKPKLQFTPDEFEETRRLITEAFNAIDLDSVG